MATFRSSDFDFDSTTGVFSQDMSILDHKTHTVFHQVYVDAIDDGLAIVSDRTGVTVSYAVDETIRNADQDIVKWVLVPINPDKTKARGTSVVIYNT